MSMPWRSRIGFLSLLCLFSFLWASGQNHWSDDFLFGVYEEAEIKADSMILAKLESKGFRSPWIRDLDLRLRSDDLSPSIEEVRVRFDLLNPAVRSADKQYKSAFENYRKLRARVRLNERLLSRYRILLAHAAYQKEINRLTKLKKQYEMLLSEMPDLSLREVLRIDEEVFDLGRDIDRSRYELIVVEETIQKEVSGETEFSWDLFNQYEAVALRDKIKELLDQSLLEPALTDAKTLTERVSYEQGVKRDQQALGFIQPEYELDPEKNLSENFGFQVGVQLPLFNEDRVSQQYDELELTETISEIEQEQFEFQRLIENIRQTTLFTAQTLMAISDKQGQITGFQSNLAENEVDLVVDLLQYQHKLREMEERAMIDLMDLYVQVLSMTGQLAQPPLTNYLKGGE